MNFDWKPEYDALASEFLKLHFRDPQGVTNCFPCMRNEYPWGNHRPDVLDSRVPAKNNTEYHGIERHAMQYHATAQYEYSYHHWLLAACWRHEDMEANNFLDSGHLNAISYCIKQALYNKALYEWQENGGGRKYLPQSEDFELSASDIERKEQNALDAIENYTNKNNLPK